MFAVAVSTNVAVIRMNDTAAPNGQLLSWNWPNTSGPIILNFGPPSSTGVAYAFMPRMNVRIVPAMMPGRAYGHSSRRNMANGPAPRLNAASSMLRSMPSITLCSVSTM
jgi:hypothetical protein